MLHPAHLADGERLASLIEALPYAQPVRAYLAGTATGRVWAESGFRPRVLVAWDGSSHLFLALSGMETCRSLGLELCGALQQLVAREFALAQMSGHWGFVLQYAPAHLAEPLVRELLRGREPLPDARNLYTLPDDASLPSSAALPPACDLRPVDAAFLANAALGNQGQVLAWIDDNWPSRELYLERGFGIALVEHARVVSWCMAEYPTDTACGIGIETVADAQGRGLATLAGRAFLAECRRRGVQPYWDCWHNNLPSRRVADKLGLRPLGEFPVRYGWYNLLDNAVVHLRAAQRQGDPVATRGWLRLVLERAASSAAASARLWPNAGLIERLRDDPELAGMLDKAD
jgi:RimJ/RimL family protein N-acetyltransferase